MVAIRLMEITDTFLEFNRGDGPQRIVFTDISGSGWTRQRLERLKNHFQSLIDVRQPLLDLPDDDPDKSIDPARPNLFWDNGDLVGRPAVIDRIQWDGARLIVRCRNP